MEYQACIKNVGEKLVFTDMEKSPQYIKTENFKCNIYGMIPSFKKHC